MLVGRGKGRIPVQNFRRVGVELKILHFKSLLSSDPNHFTLL